MNSNDDAGGISQPEPTSDGAPDPHTTSAWGGLCEHGLSARLCVGPDSHPVDPAGPLTALGANTQDARPARTMAQALIEDSLPMIARDGSAWWLHPTKLWHADPHSDTCHCADNRGLTLTAVLTQHGPLRTEPQRRDDGAAENGLVLALVLVGAVVSLLASTLHSVWPVALVGVPTVLVGTWLIWRMHGTCAACGHRGTYGDPLSTMASLRRRRVHTRHLTDPASGLYRAGRHWWAARW